MSDRLAHAVRERSAGEELPAAEMERLSFGYADAKNRLAAREAMTFCTDDFVFAVPPTPAVHVAGKAEVIGYLEALWTSFPDLYTQVDSHIVGSAGLVAIGRLRGTMRGEFLGFAPTGRSFEVPIVSVVTYARGLMRCEANHVDTLGILAQLGLPADALIAAITRP